MNLRDYQQRCVDATYKHACNSNGHGLIVVPTGGGKSVIIAETCRKALVEWGAQRVLVLSHVKELIAQNTERLLQYWPKAPAGIYSASLGRKELHKPITVATIQSVYNKQIPVPDIVLIDEAHLLSRNASGMYLQLLTRLWQQNKNLRIWGYSATPYRMDSGPLTEGEGAVFDSVIAEITIRELLEAGFLCRLVSKVSHIQASLKSVRITGGEFNAHDLETAFGGEFLEQAIPDLLSLSAGRKHGIIFCPTVAFADKVACILRSIGETAMAISADTPKDERDYGLAAFKRGEYRWLCSVNLVTTGFDAPIVDVIALWRATVSPGLYYQMVGRGLRIHQSKKDCLVLDYGGNIERHGPITKITPPVKKGKGEKREFVAKVKICHLCRSPNELDALECGECGTPLMAKRDFTKKLESAAADIDILEEKLDAFWVDVDSVRYAVHKKAGKPDSLRVEYQCGLLVYKEWVFPEGKHRQMSEFEAWWRKRRHGAIVIPCKTIDCQKHAHELLTTPKSIYVQRNGKYWGVKDHEFRPVS